MPLLKVRPKIRLRVPEIVRVGEMVELSFHFDARQPVDVEAIGARFTCTRRVSTESNYVETIELHAAHATLCGKTELPSGESIFVWRTAIPADLPPTYRSRATSVEYAVDVHASIDWWPDAHAAFEIFVTRDEPIPEPPSPKIYATDANGPGANEPYMEISLESDVVPAAGTIRGQLAISNAGSASRRHVAFTILGNERVALSGRLVEREVERLSWQTTFAEHGADGEPIPFALRLASDWRPTFRTEGLERSWTLLATLHPGWTSELPISIPIWIESAAASAAASRTRVAAPSVGSPRVRAMWERVAGEMGFAFDGTRMHAEAGGVSVSITREHRETRGPCLVAELAFPPLHLGLRIEKQSMLMRLTHDDIELGMDDWDAAHFVTGRDRDQSHAFLRHLTPALLTFDETRMDDSQLRVARVSAGTTPSAVRAFSAAVREVANALAIHRHQIPPPSTMAHMLNDWQRLAAALHGTLETARMVVTGVIGDVAVEARTEWSSRGEPIHTVFAAHPNAPIDRAYHLDVQRASLGDGALELDTSRLFPEAASILQLLTRNAFQLRVTVDRVELSWPAPIHDADHMLATLTALANLTTLLRANQGAYR